MADAGLRKIFSDHLKEAHWQPIESWSTGQGVPDTEYCFPKGLSGWVECKATSGWAVEVRGGQVGWLERRARMGGRAWIAVRRQANAGPRRGPAVDELWMFPGSEARNVLLSGLKGPVATGYWSGGPANWDWKAVRKLLTGQPKIFHG